MDFELSEEHKMFREAIRNFATKEIAPLVDEAETREKFPVQLFPEMGKLGYLCPSYPVDYGGGNLGILGGCICYEEIGRISVGICSSIMVQGGLGTYMIYAHGNEEQKQRYLIPAIKGEKIAALALTEPNAGSDAAAIETRAVRNGNEYVLNGTKMFISGSTYADFIIVVASTDKSKGVKGVSLIILDTATPGFHARKLDKFCLRSQETAELTLDNCVVPDKNLIGEENRGFSYMMEGFDSGRVAHASRSLGLANAAFEASLQYSQDRIQFEQPIAKFQAISFKLARVAMQIEAARWLTYYAAWLSDQGRRCTKEASMAKLFASEVAILAADEAMQIHGGYAFMADSPIQRYYRDARIQTIGEGTSEIQQMIIARQLGIH